MEQFEQITEYLNILYKKRYLFLVISLLSMSVFIAGSYQIPKIYKTESTVFIESNVISSLVGNIAVTPDMQERIRVIRYALLSRSLIKRALERVESFQMPEDSAKLPGIIEGLIKRTTVDVNRDELFTVSFTDKNPVFAQEFVNELVKLYVEENIGGKREETSGANRFLDEQLVHFKRKLDEAETAIIEFRKKQGVFTRDDEEAILADIRENQREVEDIELTLETQKARKKQMLVQLRTIPQNVSVFNEQDQVDRMAFVEARINQLLTTYNENYPEIIRLRAELESLRKAGAKEEKQGGQNAGSTTGTSMPNPVYQEVQQNLFELESEISSLEGRKAQLNKIILEKQKNLQENPEYKKELDRLVQERDSSRRIYDQLLMSAGQSEVSKQMELGDKTTTFRIVDPAILPQSPVKPNMVRMILMSIAAGFLLGGGLVVGLEKMHGRINSMYDAASIGPTILVGIPTIVDPATVAKKRRTNMMVYSASSLYFVLILCVLAYEALLR
ncbi:MAG: GNVR domain-containing protein [Desulfuromonadales bacterium]